MSKSTFNDIYNNQFIKETAVIGAGTMGAGIAQKIATEGYKVWLVDRSEEQAALGKAKIVKMLTKGIERGIFTQEKVNAIAERIMPTGDNNDVKSCQLIIEAVFEDLTVKNDLFKNLAKICSEDTIFATNTSSFLVEEISKGVPNPKRVVGLHFFFHPAKNRLVEVIKNKQTPDSLYECLWNFQHRTGKTPIDSKDAPGFVVNRFFVPWLNESLRLHAEGYNIATIDNVAKKIFGIGMGPFELMNVTGVPITMHAADSLGQSLGEFYRADDSIRTQVEKGREHWNWDLSGSLSDDVSIIQDIESRLLGVVFMVSATLVEEGVSTIEDTDIGARVGLRWPKGPFEMMNDYIERSSLAKLKEVIRSFCSKYSLNKVDSIEKLEGKFEIKRVNISIDNAKSLATITINRPDQLNALDPETVLQLEQCLEQCSTEAKHKDIVGIVIEGAGKAFVAGADVKYFVENMKNDNVKDIVAFASKGQEVFRRIETSAIPVICKLDGMALGGGGELALACHAIVATKKALMGFPETNIGIYPGLGGTQRLTKKIGMGLARYMIYTNKILGAKDLFELGIIDKLATLETIDDSIHGLCVEKSLHHAAASQDIEESNTDQSGNIKANEEANAIDVSKDMLKQMPKSFIEIAKVFEALSVEKAHSALDTILDTIKDEPLKKLLTKALRKAPNALKAAEDLTAFAAKGTMEEGLQLETEGLNSIFSHPNALEGMSALLEKRRAQWVS